MSKKGEYETGKSKALRVAIIGCFAAFTVFAMIASLLFGSADISFGVHRGSQIAQRAAGPRAPLRAAGAWQDHHGENHCQ